MADIRYKVGSDLPLDQIIELYKNNQLSERRPVNKSEIMKEMVGNTDVLITAWHNHQLVGISRTMTDFAYVANMAPSST